MNVISLLHRCTSRFRIGVALAALGLLAVESLAQEKPKAAARVAVGQVATADASVLERPTDAKLFKALKQKDPVYSGDLLLGLPGAAVDSKNGAVRLSFLSDLDKTSPFPVLESAVLLQAAKDFDLAFVLDRGRVDLINQKAKGSAKVRVTFRDEMWEITLDEPGARVALEMYSRWPAGVRFSLKPKPEDVPTAEVALLVMKGNVNCRHSGHQHLMHAPPGPALLFWNSVTDDDPAGVRRLEKLPAWSDPANVTTKEGKERAARVEKVRKLLASKSIKEAIGLLVDSDDRVSIPIFLGAVDNLEGLLLAMHSKDPEVRDTAVLALRHWIGRKPGQDQILYDFLIKEKKVSPATAETLLQGLHSFGERDLTLPELYEALIAHLMNDYLPCRELAAWHLYRLVPAGKEIKYDPTARLAERKIAHDKWKALIPDGKLPPKPKKE